MQKLLSMPMQIGIAAKNDHELIYDHYFQEPDSHQIIDEDSPSYTFEQWMWGDEVLTTYNEIYCTWRGSQASREWMRRRRYPPMLPSKQILAAWSANSATGIISMMFYNADLLDGKKFHNGCKIKTAHWLGFENWGAFKREHNPSRFLPLHITDATY